MPRDELEAAVEARRELGRDREPEIVDSFLDRIEREIDARVDARLAERPSRPLAHRGGPDWSAVVLGIGTVGAGIGATGAATGTGHAFVAVFVWIAIALVNLAYNLRR